MKPINLQPGPQILMALTHTAMKPIDALCELIDNAIDSFSESADRGEPVKHPEIRIDLPTKRQLNDGAGILRVRDNGPGMTLDAAARALTAGYSGNNPYDRLGLFGMGLNIATSKFSKRTTLITSTSDSATALKVTVDLEKLRAQDNYQVTPEHVEKGNLFPSGHGTVIELDSWWQEGNPNADFPAKLVEHRPAKIRDIVGRRYATILRQAEGKIKILIDGEACPPFEHCVWDKSRSVKRGGARVPAKIEFDKVLGNQIRCENCRSLMDERKPCPDCKLTSFRKIPRKVCGWVGVQRYDDQNHYGIDIVRNGRAIRVLEQDAFFTFTDELGNSIKDYPIDSPYGRIVGEVHLDHVPVDFAKQNFQRSSPEWMEAMKFIRGESSLQPRQIGANENTSPVFRIYQGYRRVRNPGRRDMYMGFWNKDKGKPDRISREVERGFLEKFRRKDKGYYDDSKWWEKVEEADREPIEDMVVCSCGMQLLYSAEVCESCGNILRPTKCIKCGKEIALSEDTCRHCGQSQIPEGPWACNICGLTTNPPDAENCNRCREKKGAVNPFSLEVLLQKSDKDDGLSIDEVSVRYADGNSTATIRLEVFIMQSPLRGFGMHLPAVVFSGEGAATVQMFLDKTHSLFTSLQVRPEHVVASELAHLKHAKNAGLAGGRYKAAHTLTTIDAGILEKYWGDALSDSTENVQKDITKMLDDIRAKLPGIFQKEAEDVYSGLSEQDEMDMIKRLREMGEDISSIPGLKSSGGFLMYVSPETVLSLLKSHTGLFFDGSVFKDLYKNIPDVADANLSAIQSEVRKTYINCLEDCVSFLGYTNPGQIIVRRARASYEFLMDKFVE
ncbi:MAG: ATP-binding protein [Gammaproteobacteria bacterium]|nr:ATP-binding protein [Gammaproteobacteria bacterium]